MAPILFCFALGYLALVFPFAYFRHDDWLILGNAVFHLPGQWQNAWKPTLFYAQQEVIWFFRPFFKMGVWIFFQLFGYHYYLWLTAFLFMIVGAVWLGGLTVQTLTQSKRRAQFFVLLFCASLYFHFGSLVWMGEGMMNCPQLFLLSLSTYLFCRSQGRDWSGIFSLVVFALSFGFKESSIFQIGLLTCLLFCEPRFSHLTFGNRVSRLFPYLVIVLAYLGVRLGMPMNPSYAPHFGLKFFLGPALWLSVGPLVLMAWMYLFQPSAGQAGKLPSSLWCSSRFLYLIYFGISVAPFLGHGFFSVGWLLAPGFFASFILALSYSEEAFRWSSQRFKLAGVLLLLISSAPVLWRLYQVGWWSWSVPQHQIQDIVAEASDPTIRAGVILDCPSKHVHAASLNEVVGFEAGLYFLWRLHHTNPIPFRVLPCDELDRNPKILTASNLVLKWEFPNFSLLPVSPVIASKAQQSQDLKFQPIRLPRLH